MAQLRLLFVQYFLGLEDGDDGDYSDDQQERHHEQADSSEIRCPVPERGRVAAPRRDEEVAIEAGDENHITLEPHADDDAERNEEQRPWRTARGAPPQRLENDEIEDDRAPIGPGITADQTILECLQLVHVPGVERVKSLEDVAV